MLYKKLRPHGAKKAEPYAAAADLEKGDPMPKKLIAAALMILLCFSMAACGTGDDKDAAQGSEISSDSSAVQSETDGSSEDESSLMTIETQYGSLYYPAEWEDALETSETLEDETDSVVFAVTADDQEYTLFIIMICDAEGDSVGTVTDDSGQTRNVFIDISELPDLSDLSEEEQDQLYAMQEAVNVLIENLQ